MIVTLIIIILIIGASVSRFYLKNSILQSLALLMSSIFGMIVAFTFYEALAALAISKEFMVQSAHGWSLLALYALTTVIITVISDQIVGSNIELGQGAKTAAALICGLLVGLISSGIVVAAFEMQPAGKKSYNRFSDTINLNNPKKPMIPANVIVTALYGHIANGAMSSKKKFSLYHTDFLDQMHLNRHKSKQGAALIAGKDAIKIPRNGVMIEDNEGQMLTMIRVKIKSTKISKGGAANKAGTLAFTPGQFRLVCQKKRPDGSFSGRIRVLYPVTYRVTAGEDTSRKEIENLGQLVPLGRDNLVGNNAPVDLAFEIPSDITARYLQFRNNLMVEVPKPATEEQLEEYNPFKNNS